MQVMLALNDVLPGNGNVKLLSLAPTGTCKGSSRCGEGAASPRDVRGTNHWLRRAGGGFFLPEDSSPCAVLDLTPTAGIYGSGAISNYLCRRVALRRNTFNTFNIIRLI